MTRLEEDRNKIDGIDKQLAELFAQRFDIVKDVIDYKIENHLPILNSGREDEIIRKNTSRIENDDVRFYFKKWYMNLLSLSKDYQQQIQDEK